MMLMTEVTVKSIVCQNNNNTSYVTIRITSLHQGANRPPFLAFSWCILAYFGVKVKPVGFSVKFYKRGLTIGVKCVIMFIEMERTPTNG